MTGNKKWKTHNNNSQHPKPQSTGASAGAGTGISMGTGTATQATSAENSPVPVVHTVLPVLAQEQNCYLMSINSTAPLNVKIVIKCLF